MEGIVPKGQGGYFLARQSCGNLAPPPLLKLAQEKAAEVQGGGGYLVDCAGRSCGENPNEGDDEGVEKRGGCPK
jgi:hypothetical protein